MDAENTCRLSKKMATENHILYCGKSADFGNFPWRCQIIKSYSINGDVSISKNSADTSNKTLGVNRKWHVDGWSLGKSHMKMWANHEELQAMKPMISNEAFFSICGPNASLIMRKKTTMVQNLDLFSWLCSPSICSILLSPRLRFILPISGKIDDCLLLDYSN